MDDDDYYPPERVAHVVRKFQQNPGIELAGSSEIFMYYTDIKTIYNVSRNYSVYLDVVNVLMNPDRERQFGYGRPQVTHLMVPQLFFGVNGRW
jgi:hypothetical protein